MNSTQLLHCCRSGDEAAIEALIRTYRTTLYRLAYSILLDPDEAEEVVQDAFIAALRSLDGFQGGSINAWLYTITLNLCRKRLRTRKVVERVKSALAIIFQIKQANAIYPEAAAIANERDRILWQAVCNLDEKHRIPLVLYYYHDLPVAEIACFLQVHEGTIHSRLFHARARLRKALQCEKEPCDAVEQTVQQGWAQTGCLKGTAQEDCHE